MIFESPLVPGVLLRRYQRFLADVRLATGVRVTAHCPNSGSMRTCSEPGRPVLLSRASNPRRKLGYTWEMIQMGRTWVGIRSALANDLVAEMVGADQLPELRGYSTLRREVPYGVDNRSRVDLVLSDRTRPDCFVEVKQSTMRVGRFAAFPDAPTERGRKHLLDLMATAKNGARAVMVFVIGRNDCQRFRPADEIDPKYGQLLRQAGASGVESLAVRVRFDRRGARLARPLPIHWGVETG